MQLLGHRYQARPVLTKHPDQPGEIEQGPAQAVYLIDDYAIHLTSLNVLHEARTAGRSRLAQSIECAGLAPHSCLSPFLEMSRPVLRCVNCGSCDGRSLARRNASNAKAPLVDAK